MCWAICGQGTTHSSSRVQRRASGARPIPIASPCPSATLPPSILHPGQPIFVKHINSSLRFPLNLANGVPRQGPKDVNRTVRSRYLLSSISLISLPCLAVSQVDQGHSFPSSIPYSSIFQTFTLTCLQVTLDAYENAVRILRSKVKPEIFPFCLASRCNSVNHILTSKMFFDYLFQTSDVATSL